MKSHLRFLNQFPLCVWLSVIKIRFLMPYKIFWCHVRLKLSNGRRGRREVYLLFVSTFYMIFIWHGYLVGKAGVYAYSIHKRSWAENSACWCKIFSLFIFPCWVFNKQTKYLTYVMILNEKWHSNTAYFNSPIIISVWTVNFLCIIYLSASKSYQKWYDVTQLIFMSISMSIPYTFHHLLFTMM